MYPLAQINRFRNVFGGAPQQNPAPIQFAPQTPTIPDNMLPPQGNNIQNQPAQLQPQGNITPPSFIPPQRPDITQGSPIQNPASTTSPSPNILPPDGPATTAYKDFLAAPPPSRDDYQPSRLDRLQASLSGIAAGARGQNGAAVGRDILDDKFNEANQTYGNKAKLLSAGSALEADQTRNALNTIKVENDTLRANSDSKNKDSLISARTAKTALAAASAANPNLTWKAVPGGNIVGFDKNNKVKPVDSGIASGTVDDETKQQYKITDIDEAGKNALKTAAVSQENRKDMVDYRNENKPVTNTTQAMMEGAQMLRPHIPQLLTQATALDKDGRFGPAMSRIRNLAAKIGTTGSPEDVQKSTEDFASSIMNDPSLSQDARVGQFATDLALMASGAGRIHGGARGGSSIQMINYMKSLLSADSSLPMFIGRLNALDGYLKTYAEGPQKGNGTDKKTPGNTNAPAVDPNDPLGILGGKK